jgi:hypothetical protein
MGDPETVWRWMRSVKVNIAGTPDFKALLTEMEALKAERDELAAALTACFGSLCTYGKHPVIEKQVHVALSKGVTS